MISAEIALGIADINNWYTFHKYHIQIIYNTILCIILFPRPSKNDFGARPRHCFLMSLYINLKRIAYVHVSALTRPGERLFFLCLLRWTVSVYMQNKSANIKKHEHVFSRICILYWLLDVLNQPSTSRLCWVSYVHYHLVSTTDNGHLEHCSAIHSITNNKYGTTMFCYLLKPTIYY